MNVRRKRKICESGRDGKFVGAGRKGSIDGIHQRMQKGVTENVKIERG